MMQTTQLSFLFIRVTTMARDLFMSDNHDLVIDPITHDLEMTSGLDEIAQRIKATLEIRYGEMQRLDPEMGADYSSFLGKNFNKQAAENDMRAAIEANVPEVETVDNIEFIKKPERKMQINFGATANIGEVEGGLQVDN